jgi:hypothetical protein
MVLHNMIGQNTHYNDFINQYNINWKKQKINIMVRQDSL